MTSRRVSVERGDVGHTRPLRGHAGPFAATVMTSGPNPWLIVGADGAIGAELLRRSPAGTVGTSRRAARDSVLSLDLAADPALWCLPDRVGVGFLCAAVTSVDRCRLFPAETRRVNVERTRALAGTLRERGAHVVFLSTNQVYDGTRPLRHPDDPTCPRTEYGRHKAEVECELLAAGGATVVRFTKVAAPGMGVLRGWADALRRNEPVDPFRDMVMSPVPLGFVAEVLVRVGERTPSGTVQVSGECDVSYAEVAKRLAARLGASAALVRPASFADRGLPPEMAPPHTTLDTTRLTAELGLTPPPVWETIDSLIEGAIHA